MVITIIPSVSNVTTHKLYSCEIDASAVVTHRLYMFAIGPIAVTGLFLNVLNIFALRRIKSHSNAFFMLRCMAVSDIMYLIVCLVYFPIRHVYLLVVSGDEVYKRNDWFLGTEILFVVDPLYHLFLIVRNWIVVVVTTERLLNIVAPLWAKTAITRFRLKLVIGFIFLVAFSYRIENYFTRKLVRGINECTGESTLFIRAPPGRNEIFHRIYVSMVVVVPQCVIYIANVILIVSLRKSAQKRLKMAGSDQVSHINSQRQAIIIVLAMSTVFTICETPACIDRFLNFGSIELATSLTRVLRSASLVLNILDSTMNFFAYCASSRPFRQSLIQMTRKK